MKKDTKVLIIVFSVISMAVLAALGFGYFWLTQNAEKMDELANKMKKEGQEWGGKHSVSECVTHSLKKNMACGEDLTCQIGTHYFLGSCLDHAKREEGFCKGVPKEDRQKLLDTIHWGVEKCKKANHPDNPSCQRLMKGIQKFCFPKNQKASG